MTDSEGQFEAWPHAKGDMMDLVSREERERLASQFHGGSSVFATLAYRLLRTLDEKDAELELTRKECFATLATMSDQLRDIRSIAIDYQQECSDYTQADDYIERIARAAKSAGRLPPVVGRQCINCGWMVVDHMGQTIAKLAPGDKWVPSEDLRGNPVMLEEYPDCGRCKKSD